jgi:putative hydrolase of the HAD superfamily
VNRGAKAVLLDVYGTLVELESPGPALRAELVERTRVDVGEERATQAFVAEITYYLAHHMDGSDRERLEDLRDRCAAEIGKSLEEFELDPAAVRAAMLAALRFRAFPDAEPALRTLKEQGLALVAASNWDVSLPDGLAATGLAAYLDGAVSSAVVGSAKPDPAVFRQALTVAGCGPDEAFHVGDSLDGDVDGARSAGIRVALLDRHGALPDPPGVPKIASLAEVASLL